MSYMTELEKEFQGVVNEHAARIKEKLDLAMGEFQEAVDLADKYGIPFYTPLSPISQSYIPDKFLDLYDGVDREFVTSITGVYDDYWAAGWQHSAVC